MKRDEFARLYGINYPAFTRHLDALIATVRKEERERALQPIDATLGALRAKLKSAHPNNVSRIQTAIDVVTEIAAAIRALED